MRSNFVAICGMGLAVLVLSGCTDRLRVSIGTRMPDVHRGASSVQVTERFSRVARGEELSVVATLIDFSYLRAITRERSRPIEVERQAYERYLRRQTTFYVYMVLHGEENCRPTERRAARARRRRGNRLDLRNWSFTLRTSDGRERDASEIDPRNTQLAPTGGCLVQGYVTFDGNIPRRAQWVALDASNERDDEELTAELRWDLESWTPPSRRPPRRPNRRPDEEDSSEADEES